MLEHIKRFAWWRYIKADIDRFCKNCSVCLQNKIYFEPKVPILEHPLAQNVWSRAHMDLVGPLPVSKKGNKYILTVVCAFSRFALTVAIPDKKMATVSRYMVNRILSVVGCPDVLYSD